MRIGLDTSVVLRLLLGEPRDQADAALKRISELQQQGGLAMISDLVVAETYFALLHHYGVPKMEALEKLRQFLASRGIKASGVATKALSTPNLASAKPGFVDRMIHEQYIQETDAMATFEKAARKLPKVMVLEP